MIDLLIIIFNIVKKTSYEIIRKYMLNDDRKWVEALKANESKGLHYLYEKYHAALYYYALDFVKSPAQAQDVVQEVFVKVWEGRAQLKPELSFKAYLFCISKNHIINQLRRTSREIKAKQYFANHMVTHHNQAEDEVIYSDYEAIADKALDGLPPKRKMVFTLHRIEGKKYDEIAASLNISKNTVRDHIVKAEKAIKKYFALQQTDIITSLLVACVTSLLHL